jgi:hypothetical protein
MQRRYLWTTIAFLLLLPVAMRAADLSKIDRTLGKEPAYQSKPRYCLVVLGPEAKSRVWLVLDGDVLYADCNGDGDLTGKDKRISKLKWPAEGFKVGTIAPRDGGDPFSLKVEVEHGREGEEDRYTIWCWPPGGKGFLQRTAGVVHFAERPREAPIVPFGGPLTLTILDWHHPLQPRQLVRGDRDNGLSILVGTPVFGGKHEAFATVYEVFRDVGAPVVEVEFPGKDSGARPIVARAEVRH